MKSSPKRWNASPSRRQPNLRQWRFAALVAAGGLPLADCFREVYGEHSRRVEASSASRLMRNPVVQWALARIQAEARGESRLDRLKTRSRAAFADHVLREHERHTRHAGRISERQLARRAEVDAARERRAQAWRMFLENYCALCRMRGDRKNFLTSAKHTGNDTEMNHAPADAQVSELRAFVEARRSGEGQKPEVWEAADGLEARPGHFPQPAPVDSGDVPSPVQPVLAGHWEAKIIPGRFPPRRRRVWVPDPEGEDQ